MTKGRDERGKRDRRGEVKEATCKRAAPGVIDSIGAWRESLLAVCVLTVTLAAYLRCLRNGFASDDLEMIVTNRYIGQRSFLWRSLVNDFFWYRDPSHLPQGSYYRPLQGLWYGIHYQLFGLNSLPWHAT